MRKALAAVWAVYSAGGIVQTANGLQTELLGVRRAGVVFALEHRHIDGGLLYRLFGRAASHPPHHSPCSGMCARSRSRWCWQRMIVLHGIFVTPIVWTLLRVVSGFALAANYVACESWINERSENRVRGRIFSTYMVVQMIGMTLAQFILAAGDPKTIWPFALAGVLFLAGTLPILFLAKSAPHSTPPEPFGLVHLFRISPLGATRRRLPAWRGASCSRLVRSMPAPNILPFRKWAYSWAWRWRRAACCNSRWAGCPMRSDGA